MITKYEVKHCGRSKKFDSYEEAQKLAQGLEKLGYKVKVYMITYGLKTTIITEI